MKKKKIERRLTVASRNNFFWGCPLHWGDATEYIQQEINNDNSHKTVKSRLIFISAFSIMVTVTLMKTAVAKNLSQSIIICVEHQNSSKSIWQPCQYPIFGGCPGIPWLPLRDATDVWRGAIKWKVALGRLKFFSESELSWFRRKLFLQILCPVLPTYWLNVTNRTCSEWINKCIEWVNETNSPFMSKTDSDGQNSFLF